MIRNVALPFLGECYSDEAKPFSSQDVCNWLPAAAEKGGTLTPEMAQTPPGLRPYVQFGGVDGTKPVRGTHDCEGKLFAVAGTGLYQISNSGVAIPIGTVPGVQRAAFAHNQVTNGNQLVVVNGSAGYVYDTPTQVYQRITDPGYPGGITADFVDGYIVGIEPGRRFAYNSDLANALEYNTLDRFTSEYKPDLLVTQVVSNNELILLSETSGEVFYNSGASQQPFRTKRVFFDKGCSGRSNAAVLDNSFVFHASDGMFYLYDNGTPKRISTRPIEQAVAGLNWSQAFCQTWVDRGHSVAYWTFPGGHTWGWDASSGKFHRRASFGLDRWRANTLTRWDDEWIAGDYQTGRLWVVDWDYHLEGDQEFVSEITGVVLSDNQNPLTMPRLEVMLDTGQPITAAPNPLFPAQPEAPTIAVPPLPDGFVGQSWPGGTFTAAGGKPPYQFSQRPGTSYPTPLGPMSSAGVVPPGTPSAVGVGTVVARVTDANGLFDEVTDTFDISIDTAWVASASTLGAVNLYSHGGAVWSVEDDLTGPYVLSGGSGKLVAFKSGTSATSPDGIAWTTASAPATGVNKLTEHGGLFVGVGVVGGCVSSPDGVTWTVQDIGNSFNYDDVVWFKTQFVAAGTFYVQGSADAETWTTLSTDPLLNSDSVRCLATDGVTLLAGGDNGKMATTTTAATWTARTSPFGGTNAISASAAGLGVWCIADASGAIQWSSNLSTWNDTGFTIGALPKRMRFRGGRFVIVGGSGKMAYSLDGKVWVDCTVSGFTENLVDVAGIEL